MTTTTTRLGLLKGQGSDNARDYLKTSLAASLDVLDGAIGPRTLLTNGGFEVNQRGGTVTADLAYAHDRWQLDLAGSSTCTITDETTVVDTGSGHALKAVYTHNTASIIDQKIEDYLGLRGRTVSFRIRVRQGVASTVRAYVNDSGTKTYSATQATTGSYLTFAVTLAIGASATSVRVGVELGASDTVYLDNASLVEGATAVPYVPLHPAADLARCQRYYYEIGGLSLFEQVGVAMSSSTINGDMSLRYPVEMAAAPTITISAAGDFLVIGSDGAAKTVTALTFSQTTRRSTRAAITVASGLLAGGGTTLMANNTTNARIKFEANPMLLPLGLFMMQSAQPNDVVQGLALVAAMMVCLHPIVAAHRAWLLDQLARLDGLVDRPRRPAGSGVVGAVLHRLAVRMSCAVRACGAPAAFGEDGIDAVAGAALLGRPGEVGGVAMPRAVILVVHRDAAGAAVRQVVPASTELIERLLGAAPGAGSHPAYCSGGEP